MLYWTNTYQNKRNGEPLLLFFFNSFLKTLFKKMKKLKSYEFFFHDKTSFFSLKLVKCINIEAIRMMEVWPCYMGNLHLIPVHLLTHHHCVFSQAGVSVPPSSSCWSWILLISWQQRPGMLERENFIPEGWDQVVADICGVLRSSFQTKKVLYFTFHFKRPNSPHQPWTWGLSGKASSC